MFGESILTDTGGESGESLLSDVDDTSGFCKPSSHFLEVCTVGDAAFVKPPSNFAGDAEESLLNGDGVAVF